MIYPKYAGRVLPLLLLPMMLTAQRAAGEAIPLTNWSTPLYWHPNQAERAAAAKALPQLQPTGVLPTGPLTFVAFTPCRLVDTRGGTGFDGGQPFSGPSIMGPGTATFPVQATAGNSTPAPCDPVPSDAAAYSFNLTVIPQAGGVAGFVTIWPANTPQPVVSTLNDRQGLIVSNAVIVGAGTPSGGVSVYNLGPATIDVIIDMNGYFVALSDLNGNTALGVGTLANNNGGSFNTATGTVALEENTSGSNNTASGFAALQLNTSGAGNTASGADALLNNTGGGNNTASGLGALLNNTMGSSNTASGAGALQLNSMGSNNTANGSQALQNNTTGNDNEASGYEAMQNNTSGYSNTASGYIALQNNTQGAFNTAIGEFALGSNTTGGNNIALGQNSGAGAPAGNSDSIYIGSGGGNADPQGTIQIGTLATEASGTIQIGSAQTGGTSIAGIFGGTPNISNLPVCVDASGVLGTTGCTVAVPALRTPSSLRFKDQIADMGDSSDKLLQLRPVTFLYKPEYDDGSHALQYGLIAEEVAKLYPEMVGYDKAGQPSSVNYQSLAPMLLNELQKQAVQIRKQADQNRELEDRLTALEAALP